MWILRIPLDQEVCEFFAGSVEFRANAGSAGLQIGERNVWQQRARWLEKGVER